MCRMTTCSHRIQMITVLLATCQEGGFEAQPKGSWVVTADLGTLRIRAYS